MRIYEPSATTRGEVLVSVVGWVGRCERCTRLWYVPEKVGNCWVNCLYTDGKRSGWASQRPWVNCPERTCWRDGNSEVTAKLIPLPTLKEQEPYLAAYLLGGEQAFWPMMRRDVKHAENLAYRQGLGVLGEIIPRG